MQALRPASFFALAAALAAQDPLAPNYRFDVSLGGGRAEHTTDGSSLDGDTGAGFFRLQFEGISDRGFGGGLRIEGWSSEDDMFDANGFPGVQATASSLFGHFTFGIAGGEFRMPLRLGLLFHGYVLEDPDGSEVTYSSFGPQFELAPEVFLVHDDSVAWSLYGEIGFAVAATTVEVDGIAGDFDSSTWMFGLELGTRVYLGHLELGLAYVGRGHAMDESDPNGASVIRGYDASFDGLLFTVGAIF